MGSWPHNEENQRHGIIPAKSMTTQDSCPSWNLGKSIS